MEILRDAKAIGAGLALGLGSMVLSAPAIEASIVKEAQETMGSSNQCKKSTSTVTNFGTGLRLVYRYTRDCDRVAKYFQNDDYADDPPNVYQTCDGDDLTEYSMGYGRSVTPEIERSVDHPACNDGRLTPADFDRKPA